MTPSERLVTVGRVGRAHGRDGSFWVEEPLAAPDAAGGPAPLREGAEVEVAGRPARVERRGGTDDRPLVRLSSAATRAEAASLRGEPLMVAEAEAPLAPGEWLVDDLVGARVEGAGEVRRVLAGTSCDLLEVGEEGHLIPLVSDAIREIDVAAGRIEVDHGFLGTAGAATEAGSSSSSPHGPGATLEATRRP